MMQASLAPNNFRLSKIFKKLLRGCSIDTIFWRFVLILDLINLGGLLVRHWVPLRGAILRRPVERVTLLGRLKGCANVGQVCL